MLHEFLGKHRGQILDRVRERVVTRRAPLATGETVETGAALLLDQIGVALQRKEGGTQAISAAASGCAAALLLDGFTVSQVVHGYGDVCQVVTGLAIELDEGISNEEFRTLNLCLDEAIAGAVAEFGRLREASIAEVGAERLGLLSGEIRSLLGGALLSYDMLRAGTVPFAGSTGAILGRSLLRLQALVDRSLAEVRLESGLARDRIAISDLLEEVEIVAASHATARGVHLDVKLSSRRLIVLGDRHLLFSSVDNIVGNAIKLTPPEGHVIVTERVDGDRVVIDVADECGGLRNVDVESMFAPLDHRQPNRNGLGLGLAIGRKGVRAMGGEIMVRDVVGNGCVFTVELPIAS